MKSLKIQKQFMNYFLRYLAMMQKSNNLKIILLVNSVKKYLTYLQKYYLQFVLADFRSIDLVS